jgi:hypothetical protein
MLIAPTSQDALVDMVHSNPAWKSWTIMKELRRQGLPVPPRAVVQTIRSSPRKILKKK